MCKQAPSPFCNRTGLFFLHFHENTATLLPKLPQITVMLLTPTLPCKKCSNTYFIFPKHGDRHVTSAKSPCWNFVCHILFLRTIIFSFVCILVQRLTHERLKSGTKQSDTKTYASPCISRQNGSRVASHKLIVKHFRRAREKYHCTNNVHSILVYTPWGETRRLLVNAANITWHYKVDE